MSQPKRILGQLGFGNNSSAVSVIARVDEDYKADEHTYQVVSVGDNTITLPDCPFPGRQIVVLSHEGETTVSGGIFPIAGGDVIVPSGKATSFFFSTENDWKVGT